MPRAAWAATLMLIVTGFTAPAGAQPLAPVGGPPPMPSTDPLPPPASGPVRGFAPTDRPPSILGAPIAVTGLPVTPPPERPTTPAPVSPAVVSPASAAPAHPPTEPAVQHAAVRGAGLGLPVPAAAGVVSTAAPIPENAVESQVRRQATTAPPASDPVNDLLIRRSGFPADASQKADGSSPVDRASRPGFISRFGERLEGMLGERGEWFRSDHAFDGFISPVSNPFLFEDPRSLTEVRPIFMYQKIPSGQPDFQGGNITYFGVQGRLAITDRLSFVVNKFGGVWLDPSSGAPYDHRSGFAEIWFGPKFTFLRNPEAGRLAAAGLQFQLPVGSSGPFQNTGTLSLVPYVSFGQSLFHDLQYGGFNVLANTGYSISTNSQRSDYWYLSGHIDWDVLGWHRIYPLFEMNYFLMTTNGTSTLIGSEGRDLINFGGHASGNGLLTGAFGARFKITEHAQIGGAFETPFAGPRDLFRYRFTIDFIWRF